MTDRADPLLLVPLCSLCRSGAGGECHTPGCALWMNRAPDVPIQYPDPDEAACEHEWGAWVDDPAGVVRLCKRCSAVDARPEA